MKGFVLLCGWRTKERQRVKGKRKRMRGGRCVLYGVLVRGSTGAENHESRVVKDPIAAVSRSTRFRVFRSTGIFAKRVTATIFLIARTRTCHLLQGRFGPLICARRFYNPYTVFFFFFFLLILFILYTSSSLSIP